jgi:hypothetical protein
MRRVVIGTAAGLLTVGAALGISAAAAGTEPVQGESASAVAARGEDASQQRATTPTAPGATLAGAAAGFLVLGAGAASMAARRR